MEIKEKISNLKGFVVHPSKRLLKMEGRIRASSLKMRTKRIEKFHFESSEGIDSSSPILRAIQVKMGVDHSNFGDHHLARIYEAGAGILKNYSRLKNGTPSNEAEVRLAVCNEIICLVCDVFEYNLSLEDDVQAEEEVEEEEGFEEHLKSLFSETGVEEGTENVPKEEVEEEGFEGHLKSHFSETGVEEGTENVLESQDERASLNETIGHVMSPWNKADYSVYVCSDKKTDGAKLIAILDAKFSINVHAIAQVIGYFSACGAMDEKPNPLVAVLSHEYIQFVLFPFEIDGKPLINAVALSPISIWTSRHQPDLEVFKLILSLLSENSCLRKYATRGSEIVMPTFRSAIPGPMITDKALLNDTLMENKKLRRQMRLAGLRARAREKALKREKKLAVDKVKEEMKEEIDKVKEEKEDMFTHVKDRYGESEALEVLGKGKPRRKRRKRQ